MLMVEIKNKMDRIVIKGVSPTYHQSSKLNAIQKSSNKYCKCLMSFKIRTNHKFSKRTSWK